MRRLLRELWPFAGVLVLPLLLYGAVLGQGPAPPSVAHVRYGNTTGYGAVAHAGGGRSLVLTVKHFGFRAGDAVAVRAGGREYRGTVVLIADDADLAAIEVPGELRACKVADADPATGTAVRQWSQHLFKTGRWRGGFAVVSAHGATVQAAATTITPESGDSGSGVFDPAGQLIGICVGFGSDGQDITPLSKIRPFLKRLTEGK